MGFNADWVHVADHQLVDLVEAGVLTMGATTTADAAYSDEETAACNRASGVLLQDRSVMLASTPEVFDPLGCRVVGVALGETAGVYLLSVRESGVTRMLVHDDRTGTTAEGEDLRPEVDADGSAEDDFPADRFLTYFERLTGVHPGAGEILHEQWWQVRVGGDPPPGGTAPDPSPTRHGGWLSRLLGRPSPPAGAP